LEKNHNSHLKIFAFKRAAFQCSALSQIVPLEKAILLSKALAARIETFNGIFLLADHRFHLKTLITNDQLTIN